MNASHRPVMRNIIHGGLSIGSLEVIDVETWSKNKSLMHPKRIDSDADDFTIAGKTCLSRAL